MLKIKPAVQIDIFYFPKWETWKSEILSPARDESREILFQWHLIVRVSMWMDYTKRNLDLKQKWNDTTHEQTWILSWQIYHVTYHFRSN